MNISENIVFDITSLTRRPLFLLSSIDNLYSQMFIQLFKGSSIRTALISINHRLQ